MILYVKIHIYNLQNRDLFSSVQGSAAMGRLAQVDILSVLEGGLLTALSLILPESNHVPQCPEAVIFD